MRRALLALAAIVIVVLVAGQLVLPSLAARHLRSQLQDHGTQVEVKVSAFPAVKLLWGHADKVTITLADYDLGADDSGDGGDSLGDLLAQTKATRKLDVRVGVLDDRLLHIRDVRLHKDRDALVAQVALRQADVDAALPAHLHVSENSDGDGLSVRGTTSVFGESIDATASVDVDDDGGIELSPEDLGDLGGLASFTVFSDKRIAVESIGSHRTSDGFAVTARGRLR
ncbi:MAG TPA: hypothetical protein VGF63_15230 [Solirubrobacteraceae bacterium]|jgi:hypothetical protein